MRNILIIILVGYMGYAAENKVASPISKDALSGKSVYAPPPKSVEVAEERNLQKEDQNVTGHGAAKW